MTRKNLVLNAIDNSSQKAVLSLECNGENTTGKLRLYNFSTLPNGIISLGIYSNGQVYKAGLTYSSSMVYTFKNDLKILPNNFSCAVINFQGGDAKPLLYGNSNGYIDREQVFDQVISSLSQTKSVKDVEKVLDDFGIDYDDELKQEIDNAITQNLTDEDTFACSKEKINCEDCPYKKYYNSHIEKMSESELDENNEIIDKDENLNNNQSAQKFYQEMKEQIDKLFDNNPNEEYLQELLPNSKWVKVTIDENGDYYVLGLLYEDKILKYICYGVPGVYQKIPPRELSGYPIWFPLEKEKPEGFGYWLSYQDADSGESIKAVVV